MNSPEPNTEMMRVVGKSDWFGGGVRITKVVAQTGVVRPDERITIWRGQVAREGRRLGSLHEGGPGQGGQVTVGEPD